MDSVDQLEVAEAPARHRTQSQPVPARKPDTMALAALGLAASALVLAGGRKLARIRSDAVPAAPSPAVFDGSPARRFYTGTDPAEAVTVADLRAMAHRRLPRFALEYLEGGAEGEAALKRNLVALAEWHFAHRSLVDVSRCDLSTDLFGRRMAMPVVVAPTGLNELFWPHADTRLAEAAAEAGIPFAQSTMSNDPMAEVARVPGLRHWWQLYVFGPSEVRDTLIDRARDAGCEALVVTTDAQIYGNREWDKRTKAGPDRLSWANRFDALGHFRWFARGPLTHGMPRFANVIEFVPKGRRRFFDSARWIRSQMDRALTWDTIEQIRARWKGKLVIKGLLRVEDVVRAVEIGADAVAISNHGGRQLDWCIAPLDILPAARKAVGDRIAILADGGVRRGTDIIKMLALGADAVLVGRAVLYGVAGAGRAGASRALAILREELERDMGLIGAASITQLDRGLLLGKTRPKADK
ncbi:MAG TPA: alpha-hydroxy acid oxidase [Stellaceae bacterium]|jgi:(S)-mandelate dehydrogenase|nr:alpha-hydroxy acid oxidase [Stellaceae bacterium]